MRHLRFTALAVVALALCAAPVAVAKVPKKDDRAVAVPVRSVAGLSGSELFGEAWATLLSNPVGTFSGDCMPLGHKGKVLAPEPGEDFTATCTVKPGTPLLFWFGSECSNVEDPPFFGETEAQQRECAVLADEFFTSATITVDDGPTVDLLDPRFEVISPQQTVQLPPDNLLGVEPQTATFVAHGWAALVRGLRPGQHTITVTVTDVTGFTADFIATIDVVPGGRR